MSETAAPTRSLQTLAATEEGREWLLERGVHTDPGLFHAALRAPAGAGGPALVGLGEDQRAVYVGQQVAADFAHATAAKFVAARDLDGTDGVHYAFAWHDMDRAGSDRFGLRMVLELGSAPVGAWLAHRSLADREPRFIEAEPQRLAAAMQTARDGLGALRPEARDRARERVGVLERALDDEEQLADGAAVTIARAARALGATLLREHLAIDLRWTYVSAMADGGLLHEPLLAVLGAHADVVTVYNAALATLAQEGVEAHLKPLDAGWLPLWWSCPESGRRLRLVREVAGADVWGLTQTCPCGTVHRFHLGTGRPGAPAQASRPSLDALEATGRWSPDLLLPVLTDHLFSGYVAGRSSAVYGIAMRAVLGQALGRAATPAFLPPDASGGGEPPQPDSILHAWLCS